MNVSPEISPDGSRVMFFSERDLFSIDLYLADAKTGKVIRKSEAAGFDGAKNISPQWTSDGPIPVELAVFTDAGVAWGRTSRLAITGGDRKPVSSAGAAARINVFGFAVAEIDYVCPLDRPGRGWIWQFNLMPGF